MREFINRLFLTEWNKILNQSCLLESQSGTTSNVVSVTKSTWN